MLNVDYFALTRKSTITSQGANTPLLNFRAVNCRQVKEHKKSMDLLVRFGYICYHTSTLRLSTWSSFRGLIGKSNLEVSFALNMLSALIWSAHSYSTMLLVEQLIHQRCVHSGPLVLGADLLKFPIVHSGYKPNCLTTFWTQLTYHFNRRTAGPLEGAPPPGCDEPTSRCQTAPSMWTIGGDKPVIPSVTFIRLRCRYHSHITKSYGQRVTYSHFRAWLDCCPHSQAGLCVCTIDSISIRT